MISRVSIDCKPETCMEELVDSASSFSDLHQARGFKFYKIVLHESKASAFTSSSRSSFSISALVLIVGFNTSAV